MTLPFTFNNYLGLRRYVLLSLTKGAPLRINALILASVLMMTASMQAMDQAKDSILPTSQQIPPNEQALMIEQTRKFNEQQARLTAAAERKCQERKKSCLKALIAICCCPCATCLCIDDACGA